jgi:transcriptional regulator of met regulon
MSNHNDFSDTNQTHNRILSLNIPDYRAAYSDRTAWLMSCFSELSYIRFNEFLPEHQKQFFIDKLDQLVAADKWSGVKMKVLQALMDKLDYDPGKEEKQLKKYTASLKFKLLKCFEGKRTNTQAILVGNDERLILAFRGTETDSFQDLKTDAKAVSVPDASGRAHKGFIEAYEEVSGEIESFLASSKKLAELPLYLTGHSLGGALATTAARKMQHAGGIAACFTFGSPRVGDENWIDGMKTPLYRIVNAADAVTMLPPGTITVTALSWLSQFVPFVGHDLRPLILARFDGYLHGGNMRYLTNCTPGDFSKVKLLYSVSIMYRLKGLIFQNMPWSSLFSDHSIKTYRKKLEEIAIRRNS